MMDTQQPTPASSSARPLGRSADPSPENQPPSIESHYSADVVIVGAGPAGSAAAYHAARAGFDTLVVDMADMLVTPRDKTCGDGLTPRAVGALQRMGASHILDEAPTIRGLTLHGFGGTAIAPWPEPSSFPARGSAVARRSLDSQLLRHAVAAGARFVGGIKIVDATTGPHPDHISELHGRLVTNTTGSASSQEVTLSARYVLLAEGVRSGVGRKMGVQWLRGMVHGVAARSYVNTPFGDEPWIHSHLELRDAEGTAQPGYGWVFPLGGSLANLGCGALATTARPARVNTKKLLVTYANQVREEWHISGEPQEVTSALLPMGGAVSRVAGKNWAAIGDTAALVNPLNGEGIDYALESARLAVEALIDAGRNPDGLTHIWPGVLRENYGDAFSLARRLAMILTAPGLLTAIGPLGMRGPLSGAVMGTAARLMGNLVTPQDRDVAARLWRGAGRLSTGVDKLFAADSRPLFGTTG